MNHIHFGDKFVNYVTLPVIPSKEVTKTTVQGQSEAQGLH